MVANVTGSCTLPQVFAPVLVLNFVAHAFNIAALATLAPSCSWPTLPSSRNAQTE